LNAIARAIVKVNARAWDDSRLSVDAGSTDPSPEPATVAGTRGEFLGGCLFQKANGVCHSQNRLKTPMSLPLTATHHVWGGANLPPHDALG
jgi:hypothetical protein